MSPAGGSQATGAVGDWAASLVGGSDGRASAETSTPAGDWRPAEVLVTDQMVAAVQQIEVPPCVLRLPRAGTTSSGAPGVSGATGGRGGGSPGSPPGRLEEPPEEFLDPISQELMLDPVLLVETGQARRGAGRRRRRRAALGGCSAAPLQAAPPADATSTLPPRASPPACRATTAARSRRGLRAAPRRGGPPPTRSPALRCAPPPWSQTTR
jgi:hypothetical protein